MANMTDDVIRNPEDLVSIVQDTEQIDAPPGVVEAVALYEAASIHYEQAAAYGYAFQGQVVSGTSTSPPW
jgi:hypothetical protein